MDIATRFVIPFSVVLAGVVGFFAVAASYDTAGLLLVIPAVGILAVLLMPRLARLEGSRFLFYVLTAAFILKLGSSMVRLWGSFGLYGGVADASGYDGAGTRIAEHIWRGEFDQVMPYLEWGTDFMEFSTGIIYTVIGPTLHGAYLVYGLLSFLGTYAFYRAFRIAFPQGNWRLYAVLVFFLPSLVFWPNGMSKDALMLLFGGLSAYGSARLLRSQLGGLVPLSLGLTGALWIRPHMAGMLALALAAALLVRGGGKGLARPGSFILSIAISGGLVWFFLPRALDFVGLQQLSLGGTLDYINLRQVQTFQGGSAFQPADILQPLGLPWAMVTVLLRPFPWEAHNLQAVIQSLEGVLLLGLVLWRFRSIGRALVGSLGHPYVRYIIIYAFAFIVAFTTVGNFGILARQRPMLLPYFLMLLAYVGSRASAERQVEVA